MGSTTQFLPDAMRRFEFAWLRIMENRRQHTWLDLKLVGLNNWNDFNGRQTRQASPNRRKRNPSQRQRNFEGSGTSHLHSFDTELNQSTPKQALTSNNKMALTPV